MSIVFALAMLAGCVLNAGVPRKSLAVAALDATRLAHFGIARFEISSPDRVLTVA